MGSWLEGQCCWGSGMDRAGIEGQQGGAVPRLGWQLMRNIQAVLPRGKV